MQDIDRHIREILADAEVEVPSGLWDAVSAGLDRAEGRKKIVPLAWWRRAGVAVAAAAAVAVGLFLFSGKDNSTRQPYTRRTLAEASPAAFNVVLTPARDIKINGRTLAMAEPSAPALSAEETSVPQSVTKNPETSGRSAASRKEDVSDDAAALNRLAFEESKRSPRPVSFTVGGNILTNGDPAKGKSGMRKSVSSGPTKTGISDPNTAGIFGIPVAVGLGVDIPLSSRISLGTGISYTFLSRSFTGTYTEIVDGEVQKSVTGDIDNYQHYIGIPVNIFYHFVDTKNMRFYGYGGLTLEKNISNHYRVHYSPSDINWSDPAKGLQFSAGAGIGVEFRISDSFGIYIDPGIRYYPDCGQPRSIRTQQPLMMNFEVGLKFGM